MKTFTGRYIDPLQLRSHDIDIIDIAHHLSNICRFNGATRWHYSVAQHSYLCSYVKCTCLAAAEHTKKKLMHDAEEAYFTDVPRPIKRTPEFAFYREVTNNARGVIFETFGLTPDMPECVHEADNAMLVREGIELMTERYKAFGEPANITITQWTPEEAKENFLLRYRQLFLN